ncbi:SymE family type I addiction module toxin [Erwinia sp. V71]|uniref:SymE family type I addiction module toxin n=1 Tax=Erwinia sp. V71 TaxID=3369424 RepID=UPI003F638287
MADQDSNSVTTEEKVTPSIIRRYKVSYARQYPDYKLIPSIILKGQWLSAAGFTPGTAIDVRVMNRCLVLSVREAEQEEAEVIQLLRKLPVRKQKQAADFITMLAGKRAS